MNDHYKNIKNKTACTECGGKEMEFGYQVGGDGSIQQPATFLGMETFKGYKDVLMIICVNCGFVAKSFAVERKS